MSCYQIRTFTPQPSHTPKSLQPPSTSRPGLPISWRKGTPKVSLRDVIPPCSAAFPRKSKMVAQLPFPLEEEILDSHSPSGDSNTIHDRLGLIFHMPREHLTTNSDNTTQTLQFCMSCLEGRPCPKNSSMHLFKYLAKCKSHTSLLQQ